MSELNQFFNLGRKEKKSHWHIFSPCIEPRVYQKSIPNIKKLKNYQLVIVIKHPLQIYIYIF